MADNHENHENDKSADSGPDETADAQAATDDASNGPFDDTDTGSEGSSDVDDADSPEAQTPDAADQPAKADADLTPAELLVALEASREAATAAQDQALRAKADTENVRRRSTRDVENAHKFALEKFSKALIPVFESLEKAEASKGDTADADAAAAVIEGVSLSLKLFKDTLEKQGISEIDPHGQPFDPNQHEAVAMIPMPDAEPNSVIEVIRKGFELNGRLIQAAQVVVSKAPEG